jgi:hypothetical protein
MLPPLLEKIELEEASTNKYPPESVHRPDEGWSDRLIRRHPDKTRGDHKN